eukprot:COSAG02_NODE_11311_length_1749_cov_2.547879_1_plen_103_part_00
MYGEPKSGDHRQVDLVRDQHWIADGDGVHSRSSMAGFRFGRCTYETGFSSVESCGDSLEVGQLVSFIRRFVQGVCMATANILVAVVTTRSVRSDVGGHMLSS